MQDEYRVNLLMDPQYPTTPKRIPKKEGNEAVNDGNK